MAYTVHQLSELAGVSARTIRYYDQISLLRPATTNSAGYRMYGPNEVNRLQQILFYRELGMPLESIRQIFRKQLVEDNERKYGEEIRAKYGDDIVNQSNQKLLNMTPEEFQQAQQLEQAVKVTLATAFRTGNPASEAAQRAAYLHRQWLCHFWPTYSKEAHARLAQTYMDDEHFQSYYEAEPGMTAFLREAIRVYTGMQQ
ncbi:MerR family transcriptional regulator [Alicyclobacillus contaminans]|uniref:MerR family transcriptional regulator n=1 Tax=Alicyclobacillus contaminans TaxID=392016 RepID=UPI00041A1196|nr:MerR family transcriptional regulator [Alicyclobacillus contaminans]GMA52197.1 MerR family transcriptional regulator [Alicyclobacillus contaminans]